MKHGAHKAASVSPQTLKLTDIPALFAPSRGAAHSRKAVLAMQKASGNGVMVALDPAVEAKLNEIAPMSRRAMREAARAAERRNILLGSASLAALVGTAATALALAGPETASSPLAESTTTTQIKRVGGTVAASRDSFRTSLASLEDLDGSEPQGTLAPDASDASTTNGTTQATSNEGSWGTADDGSSLDVSQMSRSLANNPNVAKFMEDDMDLLPAGFDPNHATTDVGNAYPFSQCTWWVYVRRNQLGLPVGSHFGNGAQWADSARAAGYWVDNTPRHPGDIMVFKRGQEGASSIYGHVAVVEAINPDGSVTTSECGARLNGNPISRTFTNASDFTYIHY